MKKIIYFLLLAWVAGCAVSCVKEKSPGKEPDGGGDKEILLRLRTPESFKASGTRGLSFLQENTIADVYALIFDKNNLLVDIKQGRDISATTTDPEPDGISGIGSFSFTITPSQGSQTYKLLIVVNAETILEATVGTDDESTYINKHYDLVTAAIHTAVTGKMFASGGTVPMWGETEQIVLSPSANGMSIQLMRAVARIDVGVGTPTRTTTDETDEFTWDGKEKDETTPIPFELKSVYVISPSNRMAVVPAEELLEAGDPTLPTGTGKYTLAQSKAEFVFSGFDIAGVTSGRGGWTTRKIYVPEADILMGETGKPGDANHTNRMAVVVGGDYDKSGTTTYYRLDFARNGALMNVLRNHLYQFNILKVHGAGYPTVEEAYESNALNMQAEMLDWNENSTEIFDDGTNWFRLWVGENSRLFGDAESKEAILFRNVNSTDRIRFSTNAPLDKLVLSLDNGGDFPDSGNKHLIENNRFRVEIVTEANGENWFVFTALKPYEAGAVDNPSTLKVTVGRILFSISITQYDSVQTDWINGGEIPKDF